MRRYCSLSNRSGPSIPASHRDLLGQRRFECTCRNRCGRPTVLQVARPPMTLSGRGKFESVNPATRCARWASLGAYESCCSTVRLVKSIAGIGNTMTTDRGIGVPGGQLFSEKPCSTALLGVRAHDVLLLGVARAVAAPAALSSRTPIGGVECVEALPDRAAHPANDGAPAHKIRVIRLTICLPGQSASSRRKCPHDLRKCPRYRGVIGSLPKRDIQFPKMTNAAASSTVRVSPQRVTEE